MAAITPFNVIDNPIHFNVAEDEADANISPRVVPFRIQEDNINSDLYPGALVLKDYNLLDNKPLINGVTLSGNKSLSDLGISTPLIGTDSDITPAEAAAALAAGRAVIITTFRSLDGVQSYFTFNIGVIITGVAVGATQTIAPQFAAGGVFNISLIGFLQTDSWAWNVETLAREGQLPTSSDILYWNGKQDALTAGDNIDIDEDNVIDVKGTVPKAKLTGAIPYAAVDDTSTSTAFTATVPGITELKNGVIMLLKNGVVTSTSGFTVNINGLGAKPVYTNLAAATAESTKFNVNYTMLFIYDEDRVSGGCWVCYNGYDSNTNTVGYQLRTNSTTLPMDSVTYRYRLLFRSLDGTHFVPANNSTSTNATAKRNTIQTVIDPFGGIYYYGTTASVAAGSRPSAGYLWTQYSITLGYSFNRAGAALTLTSYKPVYIKAAPQSSGGAIIDAEEPYVQALPTTNDGFIYIYLGVATAATTVEIVPEHPVYYHDGTRIRLYT